MEILLPGVFLLILCLFSGEREGSEKYLYIALGGVALCLSGIAAIAVKNDHVGASLSGMISIFMR